MSYLILALLLSFLYGFMGMFLLVLCNAPADNPYRVVWGSAIFWVCLAVLAYFSTGWSSAFTAIGSGFILLLLFGKMGDVTFTWGRALVALSNTGAIRLLLLSWPLRFVGKLLKNSQIPLNDLFRRSK
jgi:hypothetical protein